MASATLAFIDGLGTPEMVMIFVVILLLFGGQKLPEFARGLGKTLREFKKAASGVEEEFKRALDDDERKQNQLKLGEPATPPASTESYAGPGATSDPYHDDPNHEQHYGDYSHEQDTPATDPAGPVPTGAPGPEVPAENQILQTEPAAPDAPAAPEAPQPEPEKKPEPAGEQPKTP
ncbi:MAG: twin-arginine translocase TatA/TatE family subunit [Opitutaceae bacterium]|nr:twin-arginine translocase TatA/TatE family subunit [Opitutaceae bacterium]